MKIFRNGLCYVDKMDARVLPENLCCNYRTFGGRVYGIITGIDNIQYMRDRHDIVNYDEINGLDISDIDETLSEIFQTVESMEVPGEDYSNNPQYQSYRTLYYSVLDYKNNKGIVDKIVASSFASAQAAPIGVIVR